MPELPPWIQPANEAQYYGQGLQIGSQIAAQQAANMARQQEMMLRQQEQARQQEEDRRLQQQWEQDYKLRTQQFSINQQQAKIEAERAARESAAQLAYQKDIEGGMDPMQALLKHGPPMFQNIGPLATAARMMQPKTYEAPTVGHLTVEGTDVPYLYRKTDPRIEFPTGAAFPKQGAQETLTQIERDELKNLEDQKKRLEIADAKDTMGPMASTLSPEELKKKENAGKKAAYEIWKKREDDINKLEEQIKGVYEKARTRTARPAGQTNRMQLSQDQISEMASEILEENPTWSNDDVLREILDRAQKRAQ